MCNVPCELCGDNDECDLYKKILKIKERIKEFDKYHGNCFICPYKIIEIEHCYKNVIGCSFNKI